MKKTCILVLGMHRSGTSALTGLLSMLDVHLGSELMSKNKDNEKGYFENRHFYRLNDRLLNEINSCWDDVFFDEEKTSNTHNVTELKELISREFKDIPLFAIKDPRISFLFPVYKQALEELGVKIKVVILYRNPPEVASSLSKRNGFSYEKGILLWAYHFLLAEKYSREFERVFVSFDDLISNSSSVITLISNKLNVAFKSKYKKNKRLINDFLEPDLKHHNLSMDNLARNTYKIAWEVLQLKDKFHHDTVFTEFDELRKELFSYQKLFYNKDIINTFSDLKISKKKMVESEKSHQLTVEELNQNKQQLSESEKSHQLTVEELNQNKQQLSESEKSHQLTVEELNQNIRWLSEKKQIIFMKNKEISALEHELIKIHTSRFWKLTRAIRK